MFRMKEPVCRRHTSKRGESEHVTFPATCASIAVTGRDSRWSLTACCQQVLQDTAWPVGVVSCFVEHVELAVCPRRETKKASRERALSPSVRLGHSHRFWLLFPCGEKGGACSRGCLHL